MNNIKKAGIYAGIAVGAVVGGTVSLIGKMTDKKVIDELGENIMDSTILTGEIAGEAVSGTTHVISGAIEKKPEKISKGKEELGNAGVRVVGNVVGNVKNVAGQGREILEGAKNKDKKQVAQGLRTLSKMMIIGMLTVGAIKTDDMANKAEKEKKAEKADEESKDAKGLNAKIHLEPQESPQEKPEESPEEKAAILEAELEQKIRF